MLEYLFLLNVSADMPFGHTTRIRLECKFVLGKLYSEQGKSVHYNHFSCISAAVGGNLLQITLIYLLITLLTIPIFPPVFYNPTVLTQKQGIVQRVVCHLCQISIGCPMLWLVSLPVGIWRRIDSTHRYITTLNMKEALKLV